MKPVSTSVPHPLYRVPAELRGLKFDVCYTVSGPAQETLNERHVTWWIDIGDEDGTPLEHLSDTLSEVENVILQSLAVSDAMHDGEPSPV